MTAKPADNSSIAELKKQVRQLRESIAEAIQAKRSSEVKKLRRKVRRLKARTRTIARTKKAAAPAASAA
jgi:ribosomal protein L29